MKNNRMSSAKKAEPVLSNIPIPMSDHPLVIDLPDGQKLVLGRLNSGSVIEVATWRGTGRPDSRTNRLMLGMNDGTPAVGNSNSSSNGNGQVNENSGEESQKKIITLPWANVSLPKFSFPKIKTAQGKFVKIDMKKFRSVIDGALSALAKARARSKELAPIETTAELDINAWIENISREAEVKANRTRSASTKPVKRAKAVSQGAKRSQSSKSKGSKGR